VIAALQKAGARGFDIRYFLFQRDARGPVAERNGDGFFILLEVAVVAGFAIERKIMYRVLLALRLQAFAADIGANRGKDAQAGSGKKGLQQDNGNEGRDQPQQAHSCG